MMLFESVEASLECNEIDQIELANPSVRYRLICYPLIIKLNYSIFAVMVIYKKRKKINSLIWFHASFHLEKIMDILQLCFFLWMW